MKVVISRHAKFEMTRRSISESEVLATARSPAQVVRLSTSRLIHQSVQAGGRALLRVVCEETGDTLLVLTAYRTTKVAKYWMREV